MKIKIDCVCSPVCQMWLNQIRDNSGWHTHSCEKCGYYLARKELTQCITGYTRTVRKFLEVMKDEG